MASAANPNLKKFKASLGPFSLGMNSDPSPLLLPKNQLAMAVNASVRGGFVQPRPAWVKRTLTFSTPELQNQFESGLYQGSRFFRPYSAPEQIVTQHGGRLFSLIPSGSGFVAADISVPGDLNSATAPQAWMNQALRWLLISDGTQAWRIAYDGATSRRLNPNSDNLGATNANFTVPDIGASVAITLATAFGGSLGQTVIIDGFMYAVIATGGSNQASVTNVNDVSGLNYPAGTQIYVDPNVLANAVLANSITAGAYPAGTLGIIFDGSAYSTPALSTVTHIGQAVSYGTDPTYGALHFTITNNVLGTGRYGLVNSQGYILPHTSIAAGTPILTNPASSPITVVAVTANPFTMPSIGSSTVIDLSTPYTGSAGQAVLIGGASYTITGIPSAAPGTALTVENLNATSGATVNSGAVLFSVPELPPGRMGAYGMGHEAVCLIDGVSFIYGDADGGPSGSATYNYQDAILKTTENTFLSGGGTFRIPSSGEQITSMNFPALLNAALGQGPLQVGTPFSMFSNLVPTNRADWVALTNPILPMSLIGTGPLSQDGTISVNSDTFFRSYAGLNTLIMAVRQFNQPEGNWGNTPISAEMNRVLVLDDQNLLQYGCAANFDNRFLATASSQLSAGHGIYHQGLIALNLDPLSSMQGKLPACYDGLWTGLNILKLVTGTFSNINRTYAFVLNSASKIEVWELLKTGDATRRDNDVQDIQWAFETPVIFNPEARSETEWLLRLMNGQIYIRNIFGTVTIRVLWRPDYWPCWVDWFTTSVCHSGAKPGYVTPLGLGTPPNTMPPSVSFKQPFRVGGFFQLRFEITGYCEFMGGDFEAIHEPTTTWASPSSGEVCCQTIDCNIPDDFVYHIADT